MERERVESSQPHDLVESARLGDREAFGELVRMGETVIEGRLNWKLANDTFGETYHFSRLHKNTLGQVFHADVVGCDAGCVRPRVASHAQVPW